MNPDMSKSNINWLSLLPCCSVVNSNSRYLCRVRLRRDGGYQVSINYYTLSSAISDSSVISRFVLRARTARVEHKSHELPRWRL